MELTDYRLYNKVCNRLLNLTLPVPWPIKTLDILEFVHETTSKILPDVVVLSNLFNDRVDINTSYHELYNYTAWTPSKGRALINKFITWIPWLRINPTEPGFYGTYNVENNRIVNIYPFTISTLSDNFGWGKKADFLSPLRSFCYMMGSPLTTVQRREVNGKSVLVLCTPKELAGYGI